MSEYRERVLAEGNPLLDGSQATLVWLDEEPPEILSDLYGWEHEDARHFEEVEPGVYIHQMDLPTDAYMQYAFFKGRRWIADPHNHQEVYNGINHNHHYFYMPEGGPTAWSEANPDVRGGRVSRHILRNKQLLYSGQRSVYLYDPGVNEPVPLVLVWDAYEYERRANLVTIVDNLIAADQIQPIALAMVNNGDDARFLEYVCNEGTLKMALDLVLPLAQERMNLIDTDTYPGAYGMLGASMGGLMSLYSGLRVPEVFGKVLAQSSALSIDIHGRELIVWDLVRYGPRRDLNIYMDVGRYEWRIESNRQMFALLQEKGYAVT
ncbi:MAG: esterase family protein, partial [Chloroflexi bacterium]|nr:esterase family protein [Chloroflexota bacterium]